MYKVFDATVSGSNISYTLPSGVTEIPTALQNYFELSNGNVKEKTGARLSSPTAEGYTATADLISALKTWSSSATALVSTPEGGATATTLKFDKLPYGYYYITSTVGSAVTITSTNPTATVTDKNEVPSVDKKITSVTNGSINTSASERKDQKAIAEVSSTVTFTATINLQNANKNIVFHDTMTDGLSFDNASVTVKNGDSTVTASTSDNNTTYYLKTTDFGEGVNDTFQLVFADSYIQSLTNKTLTVTYTATVTGANLQENAANNTAIVSYGNNQKTTGSTTDVYNAKLTVTKYKDSVADANKLSGAGFVLSKNDNGTTKYYKETKSNNNVTKVEWVALGTGQTVKQAITAGTITELTTDDAGTVVFQGLANGTYKLHESTIPNGYNGAKDQDIEVKDANDTNAFVTSGDNSNLVKGVDVINTQGNPLPSTGGIGTTIFYILGAVIVAGAAFALVMRRRKRA